MTIGINLWKKKKKHEKIKNKNKDKRLTPAETAITSISIRQNSNKEEIKVTF